MVNEKAFKIIAIEDQIAQFYQGHLTEAMLLDSIGEILNS